MKNLFLFLMVWIGILTCTTSCTSYYYSTLSTMDRQITKSDDGDFVIENDTVSVVYRFYGECAPVNISIYNKTNQPLYVDWNKSAIIIEDVATSYKGDHFSIQGQTDGYSYNHNRSFSSSEGSFSGSVTIPKEAEFIPPHSKVVHTPLELSDFPFDQIPSQEYEKKAFCKNNGDIVHLETINFKSDDSPLSFRSYLTLYYGENPSQPLTFNHLFFLSELSKAGNVSPSDYASKQGNTFYVTKVKGNTAAAIATVVAITVGSAALDVYTTNKYNDK